MRKLSSSTEHTLCWNCRNATNPDVCPWVRDFTPVKGWKAESNMVGRKPYIYESFLVKECPLFKRDGFRGGLEEDIFGPKKKISVDQKDAQALASAICARMAEDWIFLEYGLLDNCRFSGQRVFKADCLEFFFSPWFETLLASFSKRTPEQIRSYLRITENMQPKEGA